MGILGILMMLMKIGSWKRARYSGPLLENSLNLDLKAVVIKGPELGRCLESHVPKKWAKKKVGL